VALIVQKYGGTSVGSTDRIKNVAKRVAHWRAQGHQLVVVVSAMSGETNRLLRLAKQLSPAPDGRELDVIAATGEQVTIGLLAIALMEIGIPAKSYTGGQVRVLTDNAYTKARILEIDEAPMRRDLSRDGRRRRRVPEVNGDGAITALGRGAPLGGFSRRSAQADQEGYSDATASPTDPRIKRGAASTKSRSRKCSAHWGRRSCRSAQSGSPESRVSCTSTPSRSTTPRPRHAHHLRGRRRYAGDSDHLRDCFNKDRRACS
jgi:hypothetical protein